MIDAYAGIGSRKTPQTVLRDMTKLAFLLSNEGWLLRSGGAKGADQAFELGGELMCESIRPQTVIINGTTSQPNHIPDKAFEIAQEIHPKWHACHPYAKLLMARNMQQILGQNLDSRVRFVVCWTPDGCEADATRSRVTGGTGQAISLASSLDIPVFNLANNDRLEQVYTFIDEF